MRAFKEEELEARLQELRNEKTSLTEAFVSGRIPKDIYKKTVTRIEKESGKISEEIRRRVDKKQKE
ncbi:MAG: hypothetical protein WED04_08415 [Promethearchaeati archaeon SRVP18_Atabeyarchaeia-1]